MQLSDWEGEFLGSVEDRVKTYGRAFADPEKGAPGASLSMMQAVKLKEIASKAKGEKKPWPKRRAFRAQGRRLIPTWSILACGWTRLRPPHDAAYAASDSPPSPATPSSPCSRTLR